VRHGGARTFGHQCSPLLDAEAMLLINHDEIQIIKSDLFLDEGVSAEDDISAATGNDFDEFSFG
jgi:hypothetical protein